MGQILSILYFLKKIRFNAEKAKPNSLAISFFLKKFKFWRKLSSISWLILNYGPAVLFMIYRKPRFDQKFVRTNLKYGDYLLLEGIWYEMGRDKYNS